MRSGKIAKTLRDAVNFIHHYVDSSSTYHKMRLHSRFLRQMKLARIAAEDTFEMGSSLKKLLSRFNRKEREKIELLIGGIVSFRWDALDVKKLKGYRDVFRVQKGDIRIIYQAKEGQVFILAIERRNENTYKR